VLATPTARERSAWSARLGDGALHRRLLRDVSCFHAVDERPHPEPRPLSGWVRVAAWNIERGRRPAELALMLDDAGAELCLLSEVDVGMARTANLDTVAALAADLGAGAAFGVEFVELGLGNTSEQEECAAAGVENTAALHGNAIVCPAPLEAPAALRLPDRDEGWFAADSVQPRVGGRLALLATVALDGVPVTVVSTHLENHTDPAHRAEQMAALLEAVDARGGTAGPAVVGGDLNTLAAPFTEHLDREAAGRMHTVDPTRFTWPVAYEPLFEVAAAHGFGWVGANVVAPTTEHDARGRPHHVPLKLDWILVRGLLARHPAVVGVHGLSDHRLVSCAVRLP
jgi:endonuclease/exonuclease/phosphatase family metal-dependent hydrolase